MNEEIEEAVIRASHALAGICDVLNGGNALPYDSPNGGRVGDIVEAGIHIGEAIHSAASGLSEIAEAIEGLSTALKENL